jgi:multicomponent Na+:H+ antiporter subunit F
LSFVYQLAALFLIANVGVGLVRVLRGPSRFDRLLAVQLFGTTGTAILVIFSLELQDEAYKDLAFIFALLAGIIGVAFTRYAQQFYPGEETVEREDGRELV